MHVGQTKHVCGLNLTMDDRFVISKCQDFIQWIQENLNSACERCLWCQKIMYEYIRCINSIGSD